MDLPLKREHRNSEGFMDPNKPKQGRHQLTPEERARGHKLTHADRIRGGRNVPRTKRATAALKYPAHIERLTAMGAKYRLTSERARELATLSAQVRRGRRAQALVSLALPAKREMEPGVGLTREDLLNGPEVIPVADLPALSASLAGKLMEGQHLALTLAFERPDEAQALVRAGVPEFTSPIDPFTLSALKRFRLGPKSPLALTRSQRAQVDVLVREGWLEVTGDSMLQLTGKGRQAIEDAESDQ